MDGSLFSALNDSGNVVGESFTVNGTGQNLLHAFLWTATTGILDLNNLLDASGEGWVLGSASDINNDGQIVGSGSYDPDGPGGVAAVNRGFLLTPVPEPTTTTVLLMLMVLSLSHPRPKNSKI